ESTSAPAGSASGCSWVASRPTLRNQWRPMPASRYPGSPIFSAHSSTTAWCAVPPTRRASRDSCCSRPRGTTREQIAARGIDRQARDIHAAWYLAFARHAEPGPMGPEPELWFHRVEADLPDLRAAMTWLRENG